MKRARMILRRRPESKKRNTIRLKLKHDGIEGESFAITDATTISNATIKQPENFYIAQRRDECGDGLIIRIAFPDPDTGFNAFIFSMPTDVKIGLSYVTDRSKFIDMGKEDFFYTSVNDIISTLDRRYKDVAYATLNTKIIEE